MSEMDMVMKILEVFARLTEKQKLVAIEIAKCLAEGNESEAERLAEECRQ